MVAKRLALLLCLLLIVCPVALGGEFEEGTCGPASLEIVDGVAVLHVYGTPEEMGKQAGKLLGGPAREVYEAYLGKLLKPGGEDIGLRNAVLKLSRLMEKCIPDAMIREMKAFAEAAGMDYDDVLLANTVFDIKRMVFCSTIVATGDRSATGEPIFGRNLDFPTLGVIDKYSLVIVYHPDEGHAVASVTFPGLVGVLSGMNDAGVCAAVMEVHLRGANLRATPYAMVFRSALTHADDTDEMVEAVRDEARTTTNNLMVCDAAGDAACVELGLDETAVRKPVDGLIYSTNHFQSDELGSVWPCWRLPIIEDDTDGVVPIGEDLVRKVLSDVAYEKMTLQSIIFRPASKNLLLALGEPPSADKEYVHLSTDVLFPEPKDGEETKLNDKAQITNEIQSNNVK